MSNSLSETIRNNPLFVSLVIILPFILASLASGAVAIGAVANLIERKLSSEAAPSALSTLEGTVTNELGISVREVQAPNEEELTPKAILQAENEVLLVTGGSSSCPINFTSLYVVDGILKLDTRAGDGEQEFCTDDWRQQAFLITSNSPIEASTVELVYSDDASLTLELLKPVFEGTTLNDELEWNGLTLSEVPVSTYSTDPEVTLLLENPEYRAGVRSSDGERVVFAYGGSSTCPVNFVSMNLFEDELQLISRAGDGTSPCTADYQYRFFEVRADSPLLVDSIRVQASEYLDQEIIIPIVEFVFD